MVRSRDESRRSRGEQVVDGAEDPTKQSPAPSLPLGTSRRTVK